ncbi:MAG: SMC-Scp complex subunit ScpB [Deltaproteobacteria bacterium]|nr:MAG: SMC-Scp complex subunit ScpB [Deltaproteobacteria bacterium]
MRELKRVIEALLFAHGDPLSLRDLEKVLPEWPRSEIKRALDELLKDYRRWGLSFTLQEVAGGFQFRTLPEYAQWIKRLRKVTPIKLSRAALETLAIVAYRQPVSRGEIEQIRGVDSGWVIGSLMEKGLIKPVGRKEAPGRPLLYGTTKKFLQVFGLKSLKDLPSLRELQSLRGS